MYRLRNRARLPLCRSRNPDNFVRSCLRVRCKRLHQRFAIRDAIQLGHKRGLIIGLSNARCVRACTRVRARTINTRPAIVGGCAIADEENKNVFARCSPGISMRTLSFFSPPLSSAENVPSARGLFLLEGSRRDPFPEDASLGTPCKQGLLARGTRGIRVTCHYGFNADTLADTRKYRQTKIETWLLSCVCARICVGKGEREREKESALAPLLMH